MSVLQIYWNQINSHSPATSIVLSQDYEGIITIEVKYPGQEVIQMTGFSTLEAALEAMYLRVEGNQYA